MKTLSPKAVRRSLLLAAASAALLAAVATPAMGAGRWVSGDIHTHTYLTDGKSTMTDVVRNGFSVYGLDYIANSEPGGKSSTDAFGRTFVTPVWRWITLSNYSFPEVLGARAIYPERKVLQGLEWKAPAHDYVSVGIVGAGNEPKGISDFEYHFDQADTDLSRAGESTKVITHTEADPADPSKTITIIDVPAMTFGKSNVTAQDTLTGIDWLSENYGGQSYAIVNHPSRKNLWHIGDLRAMNDVAPDVAIGFEGLPGHQASNARGEYGNLIAADGQVTTDPAKADASLTSHARTYGGADWMTATVGGVWDALLGEGRHWWVFNNSDYHVVNTAYKDAAGNTIGLAYSDFWPGQYAKTYTYVNSFTDEGIVDGMRSGDSYVVNGDLINGLQFTAAASPRTATTGGTLRATAGKIVTVKIAVRSPLLNNNNDRVRLKRIDVIAGDVTGVIPASSPDYQLKDTNSTTRIVKSFTRANWKVQKGWKVMSFTIKATKDMYFRLRGSNFIAGTPNQTDAQGNPLVDELDYIDYANPKTGGLKPDGVTPDLIHGNTPDNAWADLWFYSNPIFVDVK
jgi:hypothetical protein